jgi:hypothetical protein
MSRSDHEALVEAVGEQFLGWELGEWDGLYARDVMEYIPSKSRPRDRSEAKKLMMQWLEDLTRTLHPPVKVLCGCTFAHYFHELPVTMLGAEVGQALLNTQVYISFLRGARVQYSTVSARVRLPS